MELNPPTLDFETKGIAPRPDYPPKPGGLAVRHPDGRREYLAWGHPTGNTHSRDTARDVLTHYWDGPMLFQNGAFDVAVAVKEFDLPWPKNSLNVQDTMFLLYLFDSHASTLSLKPSAHRILGIAPDEADTLERWIVNNVPGINKKDNPWGAHIMKAPAEVVAPYAIGDVDRTYALYQHLMPIIEKEGMFAAYQREQLLMPILEQASTEGIRVNLVRLAKDLTLYENTLLKADTWIRLRLNAPGLELSSGEDFANALEKAGCVKEFIKTPTGKRSVARENLIAVIADKELLKYVLYRNALETCLTTFMRKWIVMGGRNGTIHPSWNSVRGDRGRSKGYGTKTGRLSSNEPNFQNIPNDFEEKGIFPPEGFPPLPLMRAYLEPDEGHDWLKRDFSSQEMRVLAHFEDGALMQAYQENPKLDPHAYAQTLIREKTGMVLERRATKIIAFSLLYGAGVTHISEQLGIPYHEASTLKEAYLNSFPDVKDLSANVKARGRSGKPVRTWGGRIIFSEKGDRDLSYKLLNHLIQGSSADVTKESIIKWRNLKRAARFLLTVHDENCVSSPKVETPKEMEYLKESMDTLPLDCPLASDGFIGPTYAEVK